MIKSWLIIASSIILGPLIGVVLGGMVTSFILSDKAYWGLSIFAMPFSVFVTFFIGIPCALIIQKLHLPFVFSCSVLGGLIGLGMGSGIGSSLGMNIPLLAVLCGIFAASLTSSIYIRGISTFKIRPLVPLLSKQTLWTIIGIFFCLILTLAWMTKDIYRDFQSYNTSDEIH